MAQSLTVAQSGGDYSTLAGAVNAITQVNSTIEITGEWTVADTAEFTVDGGDGLTITATGSSATNGIPENHADGVSNAYRLQVDDPSSGALLIDDTCTFKGFEIEFTGTGVSGEIFRFDNNSHTLNLENMLLYFRTRNAEQDIIYTNLYTSTINATNVVAYNAHRAFVDQYTNDSCTLNTICCTFYDIGYDGAQIRSGIFGMDGFGTHTWNSLNCIFDLGLDSNAFGASGGTNTANHDYNSCSPANEAATYDAAVTVTGTTNNEYNTDIEVGPGAAGKVSVIDLTGDGNAISLYPYDDSNNASLDFCAVAPGATGTNSGLTMPSTDIAGNTRYPGSTGKYDAGAFSIQPNPVAATRLGLDGGPRGLPMGTATVTPGSSFQVAWARNANQIIQVVS